MFIGEGQGTRLSCLRQGEGDAGPDSLHVRDCAPCAALPLLNPPNLLLRSAGTNPEIASNGIACAFRHSRKCDTANQAQRHLDEHVHV